MATANSKYFETDLHSKEPSQACSLLQLITAHPTTEQATNAP